MKDTKRPRETVSSLNYREAEGTPTKTVAELHALSAAALAVLSRDGAEAGAEAGGAEDPAHRSWVSTAEGRDGTITIRCTGPDLPGGIPHETAHPSDIPFERPWVGTYRLTVTAPLVVMDLYWRPDAPLRIMGFSRGDWEDELAAMAG